MVSFPIAVHAAFSPTDGHACRAFFRLVQIFAGCYIGIRIKHMGLEMSQITLTLGSIGTAFDVGGTHRAYTYAEQPGNILAYRLGMAAHETNRHLKSDYIDAGLGLLRELQSRGFGVFQVDPQELPECEPASANVKDCDAALDAAAAAIRAHNADGHEADSIIDRVVEIVLSLKSDAVAPTDCFTCEGVGTIDERLGGEVFSDPEVECPDCHGTGEMGGRSEVKAIRDAFKSKVADAQPMALVKSVKALLAGIDETELDSERGWWATSQGAEFGDIKLGQLLALLLSAMPGATPSENKPVAYVESMMLSMRGHTPIVRCLSYLPVDTLLYAAPQPSANPGPLAAVEIDAERYRFLRSQKPKGNCDCQRSIAVNVYDWMHNLGAVHSPNMWGQTEIAGEELDAEVDAAIAASKGNAS